MKISKFNNHQANSNTSNEGIFVISSNMGSAGPNTNSNSRNNSSNKIQPSSSSNVNNLMIHNSNSNNINNNMIIGNQTHYPGGSGLNNYETEHHQSSHHIINFNSVISGGYKDKSSNVGGHQQIRTKSQEAIKIQQNQMVIQQQMQFLQSQ